MRQRSGDLADPLRAHLDHGELVFGIEAEQGQRDARLGVEIALGLERGAEMTQQRGGGLLDARLAVAAGDGDHARLRLALEVALGEPLQDVEGIGDDDLRHATSLRFGVGSRAEDRRRATLDRRADEAVPVGLLAGEGDKQLAPLYLAAIHRAPRETHRQQSAGRLRPRRGDQFISREHRLPLPLDLTPRSRPPTRPQSSTHRT